MKDKQKLQTELMVLCDYGTISKEGKISAIGIFEELYNFQPPIVLNKGFIVATVSGTPNTNYQITLKAEHGAKNENLLPNLETNIQTSPNGRANLIIELQGVTFPHPGEYSFKLYSDGKEIGEKELKVVRVKKEEQPKMPN